MVASIERGLAALELPDLVAERIAHREAEEARLAEVRAEMVTSLQSAEEQLASLQQMRGDHPCNHCPVRKEHRAHLVRIDRLEKERDSLELVLEKEIETEVARIEGVISGIREVLHRFGYMHRGFPTPKSDMLAGVFDNDALILCEMVHSGMLNRLAPEDLAEVFSWFSFDRDYRYTNQYTLPPDLIQLRRRLEELEHAILGEERDYGLFISEGHNGAFYGAARAWAMGESMTEIFEKLELSEGDLVLTFNKTIDLLRQVREMLEDVMPENQLRIPLREAERLLRRDIVEQSLSLGFAPIDEKEDDPGRGIDRGAEQTVAS